MGENVFLTPHRIQPALFVPKKRGHLSRQTEVQGVTVYFTMRRVFHLRNSYAIKHLDFE